MNAFSASEPAWPLNLAHFRGLPKVDTSYHQVVTVSKLFEPNCIPFDHSPPDFITFAGYSYKFLLRQPPSGNYLHCLGLHNWGLNVYSKPAQATAGQYANLHCHNILIGSPIKLLRKMAILDRPPVLNGLKCSCTDAIRGTYGYPAHDNACKIMKLLEKEIRII